jgi:type VI secretion system protein ImpL
MKKLFNFIRQRWFISLLGVLALSLFIWFLGPLFAFADYEPLGPENNRLLLIGLIFLLWLIIRGWSFFKAKSQNKQILEAISTASSPPLSQEQQATEEELLALQERMQKALATLQKTRLGGSSGRKFLYQLPWYIIIGPPGSGKTTLLANSDLKFPLSEEYGKDAIRGVGGTRNCDWWFAEDAVLLDTAGRYTTQDSHQEVDRAAWLGFLDLLKKYRRRRPISGAIIAVSIADLLEQPPGEQQLHARAIRNRIQELHEHFGIRFPVYVLFTKCDLLAGFMEYFDDLNRDNRAQVWGMTFKLHENPQVNSIEQFNTEFDLLELQLQHQLIDKLERERGSERRDLIYTFPQQFNSLQSIIQPFLEEIFRTSRYQQTTMLRGVYFTSATQEGSPIDRIMGTLAQNFGLDRQSMATASKQGKSFFINHLLRRVIFAESGLAGANLKLERKRAWIQRSAFAAVLGITLLMALVWFTSYVQNKAYINEVASQSKELQKLVNDLNPKQTDPLSVLPLLNKARNMPGGYADQHKGTPWSLNFGLYQGDKLGKASVSLYRKLLREVFLPRLLDRLEEQLQNNTNNTDFLYEALKVYLMMGLYDHFDADAISAWLILDWKHNLPLEVSNIQRQALEYHLQALLEVRPTPLPRPLNKTLVRRTREILKRVPLSERIYARLKLELSDLDIADFRVSEKAGRDAPLVLTSKSGTPLTEGVAGLYTCAGYRDYFSNNLDRLIKQQTGENWVLGTEQGAALDETALKTLQESVLKQYLEEYIVHWDSLLADIQIIPFSGKKQMVEVLNIISGEQSPIRVFLEAVDQETSLSCLKKDQSLLEKAGEKFISAQSALDKIISRTTGSRASPPPQVTANMVTEHFHDLHILVSGEAGNPPLIERSLELLQELHVYANSLLSASGDELVKELSKEVLQVIEKIKMEGKRTPFPVNKMLLNIASGSHNLVSGGIKKHLNAMWKSTVLPFCRKAIQGLYPISANSSREITFEDFTYFFAPGGLMDEFFTKYLASSVEKGGSVWRWNNRGEATGSISSAALKQFQLADTIKNTFFRMGSQSPSVSFKLKPISMSPDIMQFVLDVDGQLLTYDHGPVRPVSMKWPGPNSSGQVRIQFLPPLEGYSGLSEEGPWALFRVFDKARITRTPNPAIFILTFTIQEREAKFELRASSAVNPFQLSDLQSFRCLQNL